MLRKFRIQIALVVVALVASVASAQPSKNAAAVNGEPIPMTEVEAALALRPKALMPLTATQQRQLNAEVLNLLIDERLMRQFLNKNAPPADPAEITKQLTSLAEAQKAEGKTLADFCRETRQTEAQLRVGIENLLRFNAYARQRATEDELKKYFEANKEFFQNVKVKVNHIILRVPLGAPDTERQAIRRKLTDIRGQIVAGTLTFADAAKKYSQCPSAPKGGELGQISRKWMVEEPFAKAAFALKVGETSDVVETDFGLHLIHVTERTAPKTVEFATCIEDVRDCYSEELRQSVIFDLRKTAKIEIFIRD
jgi:peptidyl-prolyl cis-trans isomerase C